MVKPHPHQHQQGASAIENCQLAEAQVGDLPVTHSHCKEWFCRSWLSVYWNKRVFEHIPFSPVSTPSAKQLKHSVLQNYTGKSVASWCTQDLLKFKNMFWNYTG